MRSVELPPLCISAPTFPVSLGNSKPKASPEAGQKIPRQLGPITRMQVSKASLLISASIFLPSGRPVSLARPAKMCMAFAPLRLAWTRISGALLTPIR